MTLEVIKKKTSKIKKTFVYAKTIYRTLPLFVRLVFWPIEKINWLLSVLRLDLWILQGNEIVSKQKLDILYAGSEENRNFLIKSAFDNSYRENYIGKTWLWKITNAVKERGHHCTLMIIEVPRSFRIFFKNQKCFYAPCWVEGEVDISDENFALINKNISLKSDIRRVRKNKLNFEITNELKQFHNFYYHMYIPHITKTHGDTAFIMDYDFLKNKFKNGDLLLIKKEKEYIAGMMLIYPRNKARLLYLGIKDGNLDYVMEGAIGAMFYFSVQYLKEKGYKEVSFGLSRAFLKDGVLQYKKKWGLQIVETSKMGLIIKPLLETVGLRGFFLNNPLIYLDRMKLNGAIFVEPDQSFSEEYFEKIFKDFYLKGMSNLFIFQFGKLDSKTREIVPPEFCDKIRICSTDCLF